MTNNPNAHREIRKPDENRAHNGIEIVNAAHIVQELDVLQSAIDHHEPVTPDMIDAVRYALGEVIIRTWNRELTLRQLHEDVEMQRNMQRWKEVLDGNIENINTMSMLTDKVANALSECDAAALWLDCLCEITDAQARSLAKFRGIKIFMGALKNISDKGAEYLAPKRKDIRSNQIITEKLNQAASRLGLDEE